MGKNNFLDVEVQHQDEAAHITMTVLRVLGCVIGSWLRDDEVSPVSALQTGNKGLNLIWELGSPWRKAASREGEKTFIGNENKLFDRLPSLFLL